MNSRAPASSSGDAIDLSSNLNLVALQTFVVVAEQGTIRSAAEKLHMTPPALGAQITKLEERLGVKLLEKGRSGSRPTAAGREILDHARRILRSSTRLVEFAKGVEKGDAGSISIACYPVHVERLLADVLGEFHQHNPGVHIDLSQVRDDRRRTLGQTLFEELIQGEVDIAIGPPHTLEFDSLAGIPLYLAKIVAMVHDDHPYRRAVEIPVAELKGLPLLIAPEGFFSRQQVEAAAKSAGFALDIAFQSSNPPALLALGSHGLGVPVIADDYPLVGQQRFPYPVLTRPDGTPIQTEVWMHWRKDAVLTPGTEKFIAAVRAYVDDEAAKGRKYEEYYRAEMGGRERRQQETKLEGSTTS